VRLPEPRGPLSTALVEHLRGRTALSSEPADMAERRASGLKDPCGDDDFQLALAIAYELHYRGFDDVDDDAEWDLAVLDLRARLERVFETALRRLVPTPDFDGRPIDLQLRAIIDSGDGPALSRYLARHATLDEFREFVVQRSAYHLKEADPHTWGIPRLDRRTKAALVEIQTDEYGGGNVERMHASLFAGTMRALGLDDTYGAYWPAVTGATFATTNVISMFGLHRRLRGALLGHLATLEMDSTVPNRRYGSGLRRLGFGFDATRFYDEHVEADAVHEQIAAFDLCGSFLDAEPEQAGTLLWGAACGVALDGRAAGRVMSAWGDPAVERVSA
jgi:hypothetical protein